MELKKENWCAKRRGTVGINCTISKTKFSTFGVYWPILFFFRLTIWIMLLNLDEKFGHEWNWKKSIDVQKDG